MRRVENRFKTTIKITCLLLASLLLIVEESCRKEGDDFSPLVLAPPGKPNIIVILADDYGYEVPGFDGGQSYSTPNLNSMAQQGVRFTQCHSTALCSPSRFMLLTGKYNFRNYSTWGVMDTSQRSFANMLRDAGYATCVAGKWQLDGGDTLIRHLGFDNYIVWEILGSDEDVEKGSRYKDPLLYEDGAYLPADSVKDKYGEDIFTNYILNFIQASHDKNKPFLVYYPCCLTHSPFCPTPDDAEFSTWDPNNVFGDTKFFPSNVSYMDKKIGQIVSKLRDIGVDRNTIILFTGDNGTSDKISSKFNGYYIQGGKGHTTEYGTHVPLVVYAPAFIRSGVNDDLIDFTDFLPTLADLAHIPRPTTYGVLDGVSFYPAIADPWSSPRDWIFCHFDPHSEGNNQVIRYVQNKNYKYYEDGRFYDIVRDILERDPIPDRQLTAEEITVKQQFINVLAEMHN